MEEAGGKALRHHKMVSRRGHCPEMYGVYASLLHGSTSNLPPMKNITAFLMNQNRQFEDVVRGLTDARDSLDGARYDLNYPRLDRLISTHTRQVTKSRSPYVVGCPYYRFLSASPYYDQGMANDQRDPLSTEDIYRNLSYHFLA